MSTSSLWHCTVHVSQSALLIKKLVDNTKHMYILSTLSLGQNIVLTADQSSLENSPKMMGLTYSPSLSDLKY